MPLLAIAIVTHVVYTAMTRGLRWTQDQSARAWDASYARTRSGLRKAMDSLNDKIDDWDNDPGKRRYAATGYKMARGTGRLLGKVGIGTLLGGARAVGAVGRTLAGGALATGGLLGGIAQATRTGTARGAAWYLKHKGTRASKRAKEAAERAQRWGETIPGVATETPEPEQSNKQSSREQESPRNEEQDPGFNGGGGGDKEAPANERREPFQAGEATVGEPARRRPSPRPIPATSSPNSPPPQPDPIKPAPQPAPREYAPAPRPEPDFLTPPPSSQPIITDAPPRSEPKAKDPTSFDPTPVGSLSGGAPMRTGSPTKLLERPVGQVIEGELVSAPTQANARNLPPGAEDLGGGAYALPIFPSASNAPAPSAPRNQLAPSAVATPGVAVAPISTPTDGMHYRAATEYLTTTQERIAMAGQLAEEIAAAQAKLMAICDQLAANHELADVGLQRFNVAPHNMGPVTELLRNIATGPSHAHMVTTYEALATAGAGVQQDYEFLTGVHGSTYDHVVSTGVRGEFFNEN